MEFSGSGSGSPTPDLSAYPRILPASDHSLLAEFGSEITGDVHRRVARFTRLMLAGRVPGVLNVHPAYCSILISFDPRIIDPRSLGELAETKLREIDAAADDPLRTIEIPVCYGNEFGPDLEALSAACGMGSADVVRRHSSAEYVVCFLGFSPGFPYLSGMPPEIAAPRRSSPRVSVPAGSVGIAGGQTGIYPVSSPGGWNLIGRTPLRLFHVDRDPPALLRMDDRVVFRPISPEEFAALRGREGQES